MLWCDAPCVSQTTFNSVPCRCPWRGLHCELFKSSNMLIYPVLFLGALPPPLLFFSGAPPFPPTSRLLGSLTSLLPGLTFKLFCGPPASRSAVASASSGLVLLGSKAASECAAPSSDPDLAYSVDRGFSESLSCASFWARHAGVVLTKRGRTMAGRAKEARCTARAGWMRNMARIRGRQTEIFD